MATLRKVANMFDFVSLFPEFIKIPIVAYWIFAPAFLGLMCLVKELAKN